MGCGDDGNDDVEGNCAIARMEEALTRDLGGRRGGLGLGHVGESYRCKYDSYLDCGSVRSMMPRRQMAWGKMLVTDGGEGGEQKTRWSRGEGS